MSGYYEAYPPKSMNVSVESQDVPDGTGKVMRKKVLVVNKDFEAGDVIYKASYWRYVFYHMLIHVLRSRSTPLSLSSTSTSKPKEVTAITVSVTSRLNASPHHLTASVLSFAQKSVRPNQSLLRASSSL